MSTPFPLEDQAQLDRAQPVWNPWSGPADPHWYSGIGFGDDTAHLGPLYQIGTGAGSGAEKGAALLTGLYGKQASMLGSVAQTLHIPGSSWLNEQAQELSGVADTARENAKKLTPDPATTGTAAQVLNNLSSGITRYTVGALAGGPVGGALIVGSTEANSRYQELREQGVDEETARASAGLAGITSAAGAFMPGGYGSTLLQRLATGAGANVGFGMANRYLDHKILEDGGYHEMADQQRALDSAQLLTDTVLGMGFGGLAHIHAGAEEARVNATPTWTPTPREAPGVEDAALTANLALRDRAAAPGVPVDPAAANAHSAAMEKATADLLQGNPVDVSGTGVDRADFLRRPARDTTEPENMLVNVLKESGILDEERNLQELEAAMGRRLRGEREPEPAVQTPAESAAEAGAPESQKPESVTPQAPPPDASDFVREFEAQNPQNPDEPAQRLVNGNVSVGLVTDPTNPNTAHIESVRALQTGGGAGSKAMEHIAALADQHGVRLTLHADPLDVAGIGSRKLVEWYKRFGFRITHSVGEGALMERPPGGAAEAELLPEPEELESVGAEHSLDNAYAVALTARAAQLEPDMVWKLAERHQADTPRFIRAIQAIVDEHEATHAGGGEGAQATAAESGRPPGQQPTGGRQPGESAALAAGVAGGDTTGTSPRHAEPGSADDRLTGDLTSQAVGERLETDAELRAGLQAMKDETGWAQVGGRITRDPDTEQVTGRTSWIPNADWWPGRPKGLNEKQIRAAVDKALAGEPLSKRERAMVDFMTQVHDERVKMAETHVALQESVPDLAEQPREAVDISVLAGRAAEHDEEAVGRVLDSWNDDHPETIARVRGELEQIIGRGQETLKAEADRGREPAQAQRASAAGGDLFGQDTRATQALADETRRRDLLRSPNRDVSLETGRPDDLFSQSRQQLDIADTLADHADLQIADENGKPTSAAAALHEADTAAAQGEQEAPKATEAAVNCFLRKGG